MPTWHLGRRFLFDLEPFKELSPSMKNHQ